MWYKHFPKYLDSLYSMLNGRYEERVPEVRERTLDLAPHQGRPEFETHVDGRWLSVSLSDVPAPPGDESSYDADDTAAWLWVLAESGLDLECRVVHGRAHDGVLRFLGLEPHFRTGDAAFDDRHRVEAHDDKAKQFLRDPEVRAAIAALEPFDVLHVGGHGVFASRRVERDDEFDGKEVGPFIDAVLDLAARTG